MASEQQVSDIMSLLEKGIEEAERIEARLDKYDLLLQVMVTLSITNTNQYMYKNQDVQLLMCHQ